MKNKFKWFGVIALMAMIVFSFAACNNKGVKDDDDDDVVAQTATYTGTAGDTTYTLKITENTARYAAQSRDGY